MKTVSKMQLRLLDGNISDSALSDSPMPPNDFFHRIYGSGYKKIKDLPNASVYAYGIPANGAAWVIRYTPFFDVEVLLNDIHLNTAQMYAELETNLEINYCRYGSFSCTMRDGSNVHLSAVGCRLGNRLMKKHLKKAGLL